MGDQSCSRSGWSWEWINDSEWRWLDRAPLVNPVRYYEEDGQFPSARLAAEASENRKNVRGQTRYQFSASECLQVVFPMSHKEIHSLDQNLFNDVKSLAVARGSTVSMRKLPHNAHSPETNTCSDLNINGPARGIVFDLFMSELRRLALQFRISHSPLLTSRLASPPMN
jgi:hypothetical protein